jgi:hypothetical protein
MLAAGVDTWSCCWRLDDETPAARAADALAVVPSSRSRYLSDTIEGHRIVWFPAAGLLAAEGKPGGDGRLAHPTELGPMLSKLTTSLRDIGIPVPSDEQRFRYSRHGFAGIRRLDATVNVPVADTGRGLAILAGVAAIQPPGRLASQVRRQAGGRAIETVYWLGRRGVMARVYDKSTEALSGPRATLLRFEDQRRYGSESRRDIEEMTSGYVRDIFCKRFAPLWRASEGVRVVTPTKAAQRLVRAVESGEITPGQATGAAAHLFLEQAGIESLGQHRATRYRHRRIAETLGLVLVDGAVQEVDVNLGEVMGDVLAVDHWDRLDPSL